MPKQKRDPNAIYISERLQESLRPISHCALTTVVAPMGYGKTTAINWYLSERAESEPLQVIRISVYSDNLAIFWRSVQDAFDHAGFPFLRAYPCPADDAAGSLLADDLCHVLSGDVPLYLFIDDFHLLTDGRIAVFLCMLANRLPDNIHMIVASRDRFLPSEEALRLGRKLCRIGVEQLRLNHTELAVYARRCGTALTDRQVEALLYSSEGWFSAVYLNLHALTERVGERCAAAAGPGRKRDPAGPHLGHLLHVYRRHDRPPSAEAAGVFGSDGPGRRVYRRNGPVYHQK